MTRSELQAVVFEGTTFYPFVLHVERDEQLPVEYPWQLHWRERSLGIAMEDKWNYVPYRRILRVERQPLPEHSE